MSENTTTTRAARNSSIPVATFIKAIFTGAKEGKTNAQVASELGMKLTSFTVRKSNVQKNPPQSLVDQFKAKGKEFHLPELADGRGHRPAQSLETLGNELLAQLNEVENDTGETASA